MEASISPESPSSSSPSSFGGFTPNSDSPY
jgi:hypothetical protein